MTVRVDAMPLRMPERQAWALDSDSYVNLLTVYGGHFGSLLFRAVGYPSHLTVVTQDQLPYVTLIETGEQVRTERPDAIMMAGALKRGGLFSVHLESSQKHGTGLQIDVTGTEGVLRLRNSRAYKNEHDGAILEMTGGSSLFAPVSVPAEFRWLDGSGLDSSPQDVAYLYDAYAKDVINGTSVATSFRDAVSMHHMIDFAEKSSERFFADPASQVDWS